MIPDHHQPPAPDHEEAMTLATRRAFPRRSLFGLAAIGAAALLVGCGEDDGDSAVPEDEQEEDESGSTEAPVSGGEDEGAATIPDENQQVGEDEEADD